MNTVSYTKNLPKKFIKRKENHDSFSWIHEFYLDCAYNFQSIFMSIISCVPPNKPI